MSQLIHIASNGVNKTDAVLYEEFKEEIKNGLEQPQKHIVAKYLYDDNGCELFNQITRHDDYYLTRSELAILKSYKKKIANIMGNNPFNLVDLGPGEGIKTELLLSEFMARNLQFSYMPIDISEKYLQNLVEKFKSIWPKINATCLHTDYFNGLKWIKKNAKQTNLVLFLGSSIGNFDLKATRKFLKHLYKTLNHGDYVLLGFDLYKNVDILMRAYNDRDGITREFNFNILRRLNRELGANFNLTKFAHFPTFNHKISAMESYLISLEEQVVNIDALEKSFIFKANEPIHVEFSHKYQFKQIESLAKATGFDVIDNFSDSAHYFLDTLWRVTKD